MLVGYVLTAVSSGICFLVCLVSFGPSGGDTADLVVLSSVFGVTFAVTVVGLTRMLKAVIRSELSNIVRQNGESDKDASKD